MIFACEYVSCTALKLHLWMQSLAHTVFPGLHRKILKVLLNPFLFWPSRFPLLQWTLLHPGLQQVWFVMVNHGRLFLRTSTPYTWYQKLYALSLLHTYPSPLLQSIQAENLSWKVGKRALCLSPIKAELPTWETQTSNKVWTSKSLEV